jgi:hypothetical protein
MTTKVLYFPANTENKNKCYYNIYTLLKAMFDGLTSITVDEVDNYLLTFAPEERFYVKELSYQLEIYNAENEYVYCINKPIT